MNLVSWFVYLIIVSVKLWFLKLRRIERERESFSTLPSLSLLHQLTLTTCCFACVLFYFWWHARWIFVFALFSLFIDQHLNIKIVNTLKRITIKYIWNTRCHQYKTYLLNCSPHLFMITHLGGWWRDKSLMYLLQRSWDISTLRCCCDMHAEYSKKYTSIYTYLSRSRKHLLVLFNIKHIYVGITTKLRILKWIHVLEFKISKKKLKCEYLIKELKIFK